MVVTQFSNISGSTMGISVTIEARKKVGGKIVSKATGRKQQQLHLPLLMLVEIQFWMTDSTFYNHCDF